MPPTRLDPKVAARYKAEIQYLLSLLRLHQKVKPDADTQKMCTFVTEKLDQATGALDQSDEESAWFHLLGAAKLCTTFRIAPDKVALAVRRIDRMLGAS